MSTIKIILKNKKHFDADLLCFWSVNSFDIKTKKIISYSLNIQIIIVAFKNLYVFFISNIILILLIKS